MSRTKNMHFYFVKYIESNKTIIETCDIHSNFNNLAVGFLFLLFFLLFLVEYCFMFRNNIREPSITRKILGNILKKILLEKQIYNVSVKPLLKRSDFFWFSNNYVLTTPGLLVKGSKKLYLQFSNSFYFSNQILISSFDMKFSTW